MMKIIGIMALIVGVAIILPMLWRFVRRKWKAFSHSFDWGNWSVDPGDLSWCSPDKFVQSGKLPYSTKLQRQFFRWHNSRHLRLGGEFWKTFEDGPWKWEAQQRFAGKAINCGHFFAFTEKGAAAEAGYYQMDLGQSELLEITAGFESVLDLTYEDNLRAVLQTSVADPKMAQGSTFRILSMMVDISKGGSGVTDYVGWWARREGYDGVLFFSARALPESQRGQIDGWNDQPWGIPVAPEAFRAMRADDSLKNLVLFSGARLTTQISAYRTSSKGASVNEYFQTPMERLDQLSQYNTEYQEEQDRFHLTKIADRGLDWSRLGVK